MTQPRYEVHRYWADGQGINAQPRKQQMNKKAIALIAMDARAVGVSYDSGGGIYTFAWALPVEPELDMRVIVPSNGKYDRFTSATIKSLDVDFDVDSDYDYKFVAGIFSDEAFNNQTKTLDSVAKAITKAMRDNVLANLQLDKKEIKKLCQ